ncbi:MAG: hypothetical protein M1423_10890 [Acidobacteria bacterium]|nr:hypothetical protein [Acidobacteriota bacterium]
MRVMLEIADTSLAYNFQTRISKLLVECTTLTVSTHREQLPVQALGYINPKAFARGRRTIAGTMILTQFTADVLFQFLQAVLPHDFSKDTTYFKIDQLPPFNVTILFSDEYGHASYRRLLGLEFLTDGTVYSVQDMLTEQTLTYMASDFTPLLPVTHGVVFNPDPGTIRQALKPGPALPTSAPWSGSGSAAARSLATLARSCAGSGPGRPDGVA